MIRDFTLTLDGTVQVLSDVLPPRIGDSLKYIALQADANNSGVIYVGSTERGDEGAVSSTAYGWRIEIPVAGIPSAPDIIEVSQNSFSLSELSVIGTSDDILHIMVLR
jgi:hypothetical protein